MSALGAHGLDLAGNVGQQHLAALDALDLDLLLLSGLESQRGDVLELELGHGS